MGVADPKAFEELPQVKGNFVREVTFPNPLELMDCRSVIVVGLVTRESAWDSVITNKGIRAQFYKETLNSRLPVIRDRLVEKGYNALLTQEISLKRAAVLAGIAQVGKNTLVANEEYGPDIRLGAILTDCELPFNQAKDPFAESFCGDCQICIEACPGGAISPYNLDFRKCLIPALDLAKKGSEEERKAKEQMPINQGARLECALCQKVCPHSQRK